MIKGIKKIKHFPNFAKTLTEFYSHIDSLGYKDKPDYSFMIDTLTSCQLIIMNNLTEETGGYIEPDDRRYLFPLLNLTGALAGDASDIPVYCYETIGIQFLDWWDNLYNSMSYDFNTLLISFLFT